MSVGMHSRYWEQAKAVNDETIMLFNTFYIIPSYSLLQAFQCIQLYFQQAADQCAKTAIADW